ncbi:MAG: GxxExxY protein [Planctomycetota bacterium]
MNTDEQGWLDELSERVIGAAFEVSNVLGVGYLEKVYQRALLNECRRYELAADMEVPMPVIYKGDVVGDYYVDLLVEGKLIVELKCVAGFTNEHTAQTLNYLRGTGCPLALLLNFKHPRVQVKRLLNKFL